MIKLLQSPFKINWAISSAWISARKQWWRMLVYRAMIRYLVHTKAKLTYVLVRWTNLFVRSKILYFYDENHTIPSLYIYNLNGLALVIRTYNRISIYKLWLGFLLVIILYALQSREDYEYTFAQHSLNHMSSHLITLLKIFFFLN